MMERNALKRRLVAEIENLSEDHLPEVLDFVGKLKAKKRAQKLLPKPKRKLDPAKNPLRGLIGMADVEPFAHKIDEELYGQKE